MTFKNLFFKVLLFAATVLLIITVFLHYLAGYSDYFYDKFTTPLQHSMLVGDSKSFMGIEPGILTDGVKGDYEMPMYNYSFTISQMSYGELFLQSIKRKLDPETKNGLFILSVNPWVLSERPEDDVSKGIFFEQNTPPSNMVNVDMNPNFEYLIKNFELFHFKAVFRRVSKLHKDGWYEDMNIPDDPKIRRSLLERHIRLFTLQATKFKKSQYRLDQLAETIKFLQKHGKVVLMRMPSDNEIDKIEDNYWKDFDANMIAISKTQNVAYINYNFGYQFETYDGVHFDARVGKLFTQSLCDSINAINK